MQKTAAVLLSVGMSLTALLNGLTMSDFLKTMLGWSFPYYKEVTEEENFIHSVLGFDPGQAQGWVEAAMPWTGEFGLEKEEAHREEPEGEWLSQNQEQEEEKNVNEAERFAGYPADYYVTVTKTPEPSEIRDIRDQYPENLIHNFNATKSLYVYGSSVLKLDKSYIDGEKFMKADLRADLQGEKPRVLIFHTHGHEGYVGMEQYGILEVGEYLAKILAEQYGISVLHHTALYDSEGINGAYTRMGEGVEQVLKENPSVEVVIDMHRDGVGENVKLVKNINGVDTAQVMLVTGVSQQLNSRGELVPISYLPNPNRDMNLAFSFRMKLASDVLYPGYMRNLYLARWRYSTYLKPLSLLLEVGAQTNTLEEAKAAMIPFAEILYTILTGNG